MGLLHAYILLEWGGSIAPSYFIYITISCAAVPHVLIFLFQVPEIFVVIRPDIQQIRITYIPWGGGLQFILSLQAGQGDADNELLLC